MKKPSLQIEDAMNRQQITLEPITPGQEERCPSWKGFARGSFVRFPACQYERAETAVKTRSGETIVEYLTWSLATQRAILEAMRRQKDICVVCHDDPALSTVVTPSGVFSKRD